jgi:hypothetical protein
MCGKAPQNMLIQSSQWLWDERSYFRFAKFKPLKGKKYFFYGRIELFLLSELIRKETSLILFLQRFGVECLKGIEQKDIPVLPL